MRVVYNTKTLHRVATLPCIFPVLSRVLSTTLPEQPHCILSADVSVCVCAPLLCCSLTRVAICSHISALPKGEYVSSRVGVSFRFVSFHFRFRLRFLFFFFFLLSAFFVIVIEVVAVAVAVAVACVSHFPCPFPSTAVCRLP